MSAIVLRYVAQTSTIKARSVTEKDKSIDYARPTSAFLLTSADCSSFLFLAAWRNPPGTDAAAYYRPLSAREAITENHISTTFLTPHQQLYLYMCVTKFTKYLHMKYTAS